MQFPNNTRRPRNDYMDDPESRKFDHGLFLYNLPNFITQEILWNSIKQVGGHVDVLQIIVPRERNTSKHPGYAFLQLQTREQALNLRQKVNFLDIIGTKIRASVIGKTEDQASVVVKNLPVEADEKQLETICSRFGTIFNSKLDKNPNFAKQGKFLYVQFEKNAEADAFIKQVNEKQVDELKAEGIVALSWNRFARNEIENQSLFFRDYEAMKFSDEIFDDDKLLDKEVDKITLEIQKYFQDFSLISIYVKINPIYKAPICFVGFETRAEAEQAQARAQNDSAIPFKYVVYCKTFEQLRDEREKKLDDKYIYMKNLKSTVDEDALKAAIEKVTAELSLQTPIKVASLRLREPRNNSQITTKFATVVLESNGLLQHLKQAAKNHTTDFSKLFEEKKAFVQLLHHKFFHKKFLQNKRQKTMIDQNFNSMQYLPAPFGLQNPQGLPISRLSMPGQPFLGMAPPGMGLMNPFQLPPGLTPAPFIQQPLFQQPQVQQLMPPSLGYSASTPQFIQNRFPNQQSRVTVQPPQQQFGGYPQFQNQRPQAGSQYQQQFSQQNSQFRQGYRGQQSQGQGFQRQGGYPGGQQRTQNPNYSSHHQFSVNQQRPNYQQGQQQFQGGNRPQSQGNTLNQGGQFQSRPNNYQGQNQGLQGPRPNQQQGGIPVQGNPRPVTQPPKQIQQVTAPPKLIQKN